jgi:NADPH-ferrihemoprotein reductase
MAFAVLDVILALGVGIALVVAFKLFGTSSAAPSAVQKPKSIAVTSSNSNSTSSSAAAVSKADKQAITIVFGSQSGTAENFAHDLAEEGRTQGFNARCLDLEEFEPTQLTNESVVIFVVATFGEGEPTDNAAGFWEYINDKERDPSDMSHLTFAVFALGNRQYRHFCAVGKKIDTEMSAMGGERLLPLGLGDDDGTLEEDFESWRAALWAAARVKYMASSAQGATATAAFTSTLDVTYFPADSAQLKSYVGGLAKVQKFFHEPAKEHATAIVTVTASRELRAVAGAAESTVHLELDLEPTKLTYRTADNAGVHPRNDFKMAGRLAKRLGVDMTTLFAVRSKSSRKLHVPSPCTVEDALLYFIDINSCPRGKFPAIFATYTTDAKEKARLEHFASEAGKDDFHKERYNWLEFLEAFPGVDVPFAHFLEMCPRLQPRYYTIASSAKVQPKTMALTVSRLVKDKPHGREHHGVCSALLCDSASDNSVARAAAQQLVVYVRQSSFRLPVRGGTPIIMVGPGTGIAPFRGFIQEFATRKEEHRFGDTVLYFGCRHEAKDYIYREELEAAKAAGVLTELNLAFSRDGAEKVYVQDLIKRNAKRTWELIAAGAYIYVCGATGMGRDVYDTMVNICVEHGNMTPAAGATFVDKLQRTNRYVQELWSA